MAQAEAGLGPASVQTADRILTDQDQHWPLIAHALAENDDIMNFGQLLLICANVPEAALPTCAAIARLYPDQTAAVVQAVSNHTWQ